MKIAIPIFENRISPRLDCAKKILLVKVEEAERKIFYSEEKVFQTAGFNESTDFFVLNEIDTVICGGISIEVQDFLMKNDIRIISWVTGEAYKALNLFLKGELVSGAMLCPGMKMRRWRFCCQEKEENQRMCDEYIKLKNK
jgi:predicted Fe-Mo cluster-binding NifX family protein